MKSLRWLLILVFGFSLFNCADGKNYILYLQYQPQRDFPSLQEKLGSTLGMVPFKDDRPDTLYIGIHTPLQGGSSHFKSDPFPLQKAIEDSLSQAVSRQGVRTVSVADWDGKPESLKGIATDSILMIQINKFWTEGRAAPFRTTIKTSIQLVIHLGVKKEGEVFTRNVEIEKEMTVARSTPERVEKMINQMLTDIFDAYFSNPY
jgi:hypothetical protein